MKNLVRVVGLVGALVASLAGPGPVVFAASTPPAGLGPLHAIVWQASADQGVSYALMDCLTEAESHYDQYAVSPTNDYGLTQIHVWPDGSSLLDLTPWAGGDLFNASVSENGAAWLVARGYGPRWSTWWGCGGG